MRVFSSVLNYLFILFFCLFYIIFFFLGGLWRDPNIENNILTLYRGLASLTELTSSQVLPQLYMQKSWKSTLKQGYPKLLNDFHHL